MTAPRMGPRQVVYENSCQQIHRVKADFGDVRKEFSVNVQGRRVGAVIARDAKILLVRQFRILIQRLSWEIPGGKMDPDETLQSGAARECLDETGLRCRNLKSLLFFHPDLDTFGNPTHLFETTEFSKAPEAERHRDEIS
jgi:8-oxo-dGTP pyrophosphatase MutT (NUDIX family)